MPRVLQADLWTASQALTQADIANRHRCDERAYLVLLRLADTQLKHRELRQTTSTLIDLRSLDAGAAWISLRLV